jgi:hypothetical protein
VHYFRKVQPHHIVQAIEEISEGIMPARFGPSTDYDLLLESGERLPPKAVFGRAAELALGFPTNPDQFHSGRSSFCFKALSEYEFEIVKKGAAAKPPRSQDDDIEVGEGDLVLRDHERWERKRNRAVVRAKISKMRELYGKLFCEECDLDPVETYGPHGEACIEVHHAKTHVRAMQPGHRTTVEDLLCLCANCHRVEHRRAARAGSK